MKKPLFDKSLLTVCSSSGNLNFLKLAIPIFIGVVFESLITTFSTTILSGYSEEAVVATGTVNTIFALFLGVFSNLAVGISVVISNYLGAEKIKESQNAIYIGIMLMGVLGLIFMTGIFIFSSAIANAMNLTGIAFSMAVTYIKWRSVGLFFMALSSVLLAQLRCFGYSKSTVVIGVIKTLFNVAFSYYAVNIATIPMLSGVSGVGIGDMLCQIAAFIMSLGVFFNAKIQALPIHSIKKILKFATKISMIGFPIFISSANYNLAQVITNSFVVRMGLDDISGKIYFANILQYAFIFSSVAGTVNLYMIGRLYGAKNYEHAERLNKMLVSFTVPLNVFMVLIILIFRVPLLSIFTQNNAIFRMAVPIILLDIIVEMSRGFSHVYEYALRGVRDMNVVMIVTTCSCWIFAVGLSYVMSITLGLGLIGCYIGFAVDEAVRAFVSFYRWRKGAWKHKNNISAESY